MSHLASTLVVVSAPRCVGRCLEHPATSFCGPHEHLVLQTKILASDLAAAGNAPYDGPDWKMFKELINSLEIGAHLQLLVLLPVALFLLHTIQQIEKLTAKRHPRV